jgi:glucosamine 6-phosphate synthetase-like amidotransferase/phosphosugar isomerase protein
MDLEDKSEKTREEKISESMKGNQNARKKPFTEQMKRFIVQNPEKMDKIIQGLFTEAEEGSLAALSIIMDRVEGKPTQSTEISGPEGEKLVTHIGFSFVDVERNQEG